MAPTNPLLDAVLDFLSQKKQFAAIRPDKTGDTERKVAFEFSDGTEVIRTFKCDRTTFMHWWKRTTEYLRNAKSAADAFPAPPDT